MRNPWLLAGALLSCTALSQRDGSGTPPQPGTVPKQFFPPSAPGGHSLLRRAALAFPAPQSETCGNYIPCGSTCIPPGYTCCPSGEGGCPSTHYCDNGGCCENGKTCSGPPGACPDGTKSCAGANCIPEGDPCPSDTQNVPTFTSNAPAPTGTFNPQPGQGGYATYDGTCVSGFKLCGSNWCIENEGACCNGGAFACAAGAHCAVNSCADTCTSGEKQCGLGCILSSYDCCGDDGSSCATGRYCSNGACYEEQSQFTVTEASTTTERQIRTRTAADDTETEASSFGGGGGGNGPSGGPGRAYLTSNAAVATFFVIVAFVVGPVVLGANGRW